jgi:hypothetical protein
MNFSGKPESDRRGGHCLLQRGALQVSGYFKNFIK